MMKNDSKLGAYSPVRVDKKYNTTTLPLEVGDIFWRVELGKRGSFDVAEQIDAEILSTLLTIEDKINRLFKR